MLLPGCLVLAFFARTMSLPMVDAVLALISVGMGTMLPITTVAVQNAVQPHELGTTTAAIGFFRQLGGALLVAIFGAIVLGAEGHGSTALLNPPARRARHPLRLDVHCRAIAFGLAFLMLWLMEERPLRGSAPRTTSDLEGFATIRFKRCTTQLPLRLPRARRTAYPPPNASGRGLFPLAAQRSEKDMDMGADSDFPSAMPGQVTDTTGVPPPEAAESAGVLGQIPAEAGRPVPPGRPAAGGHRAGYDRGRSARRERGPFYAALDLGTNNCRLLIAEPSARLFESSTPSPASSASARGWRKPEGWPRRPWSGRSRRFGSARRSSTSARWLGCG